MTTRNKDVAFRLIRNCENTIDVGLIRTGEPNSLRLAKYLLATSYREEANGEGLEAIDEGDHNGR